MKAIIMYLLIMFSQMVNLIFATIRPILTARGEKTINTICCLVQNIFYVVGTAYVIVGVTEDPVRIVFYLIGCTLGCYLGMVLDEKLAIGTDMLTVIIDRKDSDRLTTFIRDNGFAVTTMDAKSTDKDKEILMIGIKRKKEKKLINSILKNEKNAVIIDESVGTVGGYYK